MTSDSLFRAARPPRGLILLGQPVSHSLSPVFQQAALRAAGFDLVYATREVAAAALADVLQECRGAGIAGNVTMPHKQAVHRLAARLSPVAQRTGAVNTFWWDDDALVGHNTDVDGVTATLRALAPQGLPAGIVLVGAGGAAASVLAAVSSLRDEQGASDTWVTIVARQPERATALLHQLEIRGHVVSEVHAVAWERMRLVVNATPLGMGDDDPVPVPIAMLAHGTAVFDLVYRPHSTAWVREARAQGLAAEDGLRMLVEQGAAAFRCWFGRPPSLEEMWRALGLPVPDPHAVRP